MATTPDKILEEALMLPSNDRARLAAALLASLDSPEAGDEDEVAKAWADEIDRRADEVLMGRAVTEPWEEVRAELLARIKRT